MFLQALIDDIQAAGIATFGETMYGSQYPLDAPDECILIRESSGPEPGKALPVEEFMIQVLSRAITYPAAVAKARQVYRRYHGEVVGSDQWLSKHNYFIGGHYVRMSKALQIPSDISPDSKGRSEVSFNILFQIFSNS